MDKNLPLSLKRQVFNQCIIPTTAYGCKTWAINKQQMTKIRSMQRAMERKIPQIKLKDKILHRDIRKQTNFEDVQKHTNPGFVGEYPPSFIRSSHAGNE